MPKQLLIVLVCLISFTFLKGQQPAADSLQKADPAETATIAIFHRTTGLQSELYNGRLHLMYPSGMQGSAYYLSNDPQPGTIQYEGITFYNVPMWYDQVRDKVVVQHFSMVTSFEPASERVSGFSFTGHTFVHMIKQGENSTLADGFYEVLCSGTLSLFAKRTKLVVEYIESMELKRRIDIIENFYLKKEGAYYPVRNRRAFYALLKARKKEVRLYIKRNGLKFRKDFENTLTKAVVYYNQLTH